MSPSTRISYARAVRSIAAVNASSAAICSSLLGIAGALFTEEVRQHLLESRAGHLDLDTALNTGAVQHGPDRSDAILRPDLVVIFVPRPGQSDQPQRCDL